VQVILLLYIANWLVHLLWRRGSDPDSSAIPYLTAMGDLLGTVLLALAFFILSMMVPRSSPVSRSTRPAIVQSTTFSVKVAGAFSLF